MKKMSSWEKLPADSVDQVATFLGGSGVKITWLDRKGMKAFEARDKDTRYIIVQKVNEDDVPTGPVMQKKIPLTKEEKRERSRLRTTQGEEKKFYVASPRWIQTQHIDLSRALAHLASQLAPAPLVRAYAGNMVAIQIADDRIDEYLAIPGEGVRVRVVEIYPYRHPPSGMVATDMSTEEVQ